MKITQPLLLAALLATSTAARAHETEGRSGLAGMFGRTHCEEPAPNTRSELLGAMKDRKIENLEAERDEQAKAEKGGAREALRAEILARSQGRRIEHLEAENAKMRALLAVLGVDVDKALAGR